MKKWQGILLAILIAAVPVLSACDMLGFDSKSKQQKEYEERLKAIEEQQEANRKAQEEYYKQLEDSLNDYLKQYQEYQKQQLEQQGYSVNQTQQ
jgi:uncharacterized protein HemX